MRGAKGNVMGAREAATVLVVEDEPEILHLMKQVLSRDFNVSVAGSAEEALKLLRAEKFHAVVSDHMLPAMSGVELLKQVALLQPDAARVLVTASTRIDTAQEAVNIARVKRFLAKPFRAADLLSTVGEAVHEAAVAQIKSHLVRELKERNDELSRALATLEAHDDELSQKLQGLAFRDGVTGLYTHRYFHEALSAELARAKMGGVPRAVAMVDVDHFRAWNREYGFAEGDLLLRRVAGTLVACEAPARYGSNRFAVLLPGMSGPEAAAWAEKIRGDVERLGQSRGVPGPFTARVAISVYPDDGAEEDTLIDVVEQRLEDAGREGGNRVLSPGLSAQ